MKLTIIGAGGLRTPMFVEAACRFTKSLGLSELCLADIDSGRLQIASALSRYTAKASGSKLKLTTTTNMKKAISGADFVVTSIRAGVEKGRVKDERVPIAEGVIGQETTGPGGMAMAMRSIPAILEYARMIEKLSPNAWLLNFTNPAGLVVQALRDAGHEKTIGICDSAENPRKYASAFLGKTRNDYDLSVFGLNHLSYAGNLSCNGRDLTKRLLNDDEFLKTYYGLFDPKWIRKMGLFPNEYLYYYEYTAHAMEEMRTAKKTRGEQVLALNNRFYRGYKKLGKPVNLAKARELYDRIINTRHETYMDYAWDRTGEERPDLGHDAEVEGYAGVALLIISAISKKKEMRIAVNVPNRLPDGKPAIAGLTSSDVVEISCTFDGKQIIPDRFDNIPEEAKERIQAVKRYEMLVCHAIRSRKKQDAVDACAAHPLVPSPKVAEKIVTGYLKAHRKDVGTWK